jgi:hypothetical protein
MMKFPTSNGVGCEHRDQELARNYYSVVVRGASHVVHVVQETPTAESEIPSTEPIEAIEQLILGEGRSLHIGTQLPEAEKTTSKEFLKKHEAVFAWLAVDMPGLS